MNLFTSNEYYTRKVANMAQLTEEEYENLLFETLEDLPMLPGCNRVLKGTDYTWSFSTSPDPNVFTGQNSWKLYPKDKPYTELQDVATITAASP